MTTALITNCDTCGKPLLPVGGTGTFKTVGDRSFHLHCSPTIAPPAEAAPEKAGDRMQPFIDALNFQHNTGESIANIGRYFKEHGPQLAEVLIAEREASAALRREVERLKLELDSVYSEMPEDRP